MTRVLPGKTGWNRRMLVAAAGVPLAIGLGRKMALAADAGGVRRPGAFHHDPADLKAPGVVPWSDLAELDVSSESIGPLRTVFKVGFNEAARRLDGRSVRLMGYQFARSPGAQYETFLLTAFPPACPYCLPAGPTQIVEVNASEAVPSTNEAIVLEGRFELLSDDPSGFYYRLHDARQLLA